jgi:GxxExxY protein
MPRAAGEGVLYPELSYKIMQLALEVHNTLGPGFAENIYEAALVYELSSHAIPYVQQAHFPVVYTGKSIDAHRLDLIVDGKIILELKAVTALNDLFKQQLLSYLKVTGLRSGILLNFEAKRVESARIVN